MLEWIWRRIHIHKVITLYQRILFKKTTKNRRIVLLKNEEHCTLCGKVFTAYKFYNVRRKE